MISSKKLGRMVTADVDKALANIGASTPKPEMKGDGAELKAAVAPKNDLSFAEAFKANRMAGNKTFTWKGKSYNTKMAGEGASRSGATRRSAAGTPATPANVANNQSNTPPVGSRQNPVKPDTKEDIQVTAKPRTSKDRSAEARTRFGKVVESVNPFRAIAKGIDYALTPSSRTANRTSERPAPNKAQRLEGLRRAAEAPGASRFAKDRYKAAQETGMYRKGGKIDGCAVRGKTRAMKKGK